MTSPASDIDPNIRPQTVAAYASLLFLSVVGIWQVDINAEELSPSETPLAQTISPPASYSNVLTIQRDPLTTSSVSTTQETVTTEIAFNTIYINEPTWHIGTSEITQTGKPGSHTQTFAITTYFGDEIDRQLLSEEIIEPISEIITRGTKPITIDTSSGPFTYSRTITAWATSYDGNCLGCSGTTYTGTSVKHGICAVDPSVIPLGTRFYVPDYGICVAADIGGAIKGNKVDLGFEDVRFGWWSARWTPIYIQ